MSGWAHIPIAGLETSKLLMDVEAHLRAIFFEQMEGPDAFHQGSPRRSRRIVKRQADAADTALIAQATESQEMAHQDREIARIAHHHKSKSAGYETDRQTCLAKQTICGTRPAQDKRCPIVPSDPFLMTRFVNKMVHLKTDRPTGVKIEIEFLGKGSWELYEKVAVNGYARHIFPKGFSAHWVPLTSSVSCSASAEFMYT